MFSPRNFSFVGPDIQESNVLLKALVVPRPHAKIKNVKPTFRTHPPAPRRGATRLRSVCSILYIWPRFAMESYYSLDFLDFHIFGSSKRSISHFSCLMSHVSGLLDCLLSPKKRPIATKPLAAQDLGWPQNHMKIHEFSSQSPRQQKPWKLVPRLPKIMKNRPWNHKKSNFCESWFLQYLPCQTLVFPIPDTQI